MSGRIPVKNKMTEYCFYRGLINHEPAGCFRVSCDAPRVSVFVMVADSATMFPRGHVYISFQRKTGKGISFARAT